MNKAHVPEDKAGERNDPSTVCSFYPLPVPEDIRAFRASLGLTQAQFARLYGVNTSTVQRWEKPNGKPLPTSKVTRMFNDIGRWVEQRWGDLRRTRHQSAGQ